MFEQKLLVVNFNCSFQLISFEILLFSEIFKNSKHILLQSLSSLNSYLSCVVSKFHPRKKVLVFGLFNYSFLNFLFDSSE